MLFTRESTNALSASYQKADFNTERMAAISSNSSGLVLIMFNQLDYIIHVNAIDNPAATNIKPTINRALVASLKIM